MSNPESKDEMTALVVASAHNLANRSSLVIRGLRDISTGLQEDSFKSAEDCALELFEQNKFEEAIAICTSGLDANPKDEVLWLIKGMCFSKQTKYEELLNCVLPLLEIDGQNPRYWSHVAEVLHRLGRHEEELKYWREVIHIDPQYIGAWKRIGDCLFTLGRYEEAVQAFESELKIDSSDEYCRSRRQDAFAAISGQWSSEVVPTLIVTLENWWTEPAPKGPLVEVTTRIRCFNFRCSIESVSGKEQLLGKHITLLQRQMGAKEAYWVADGLFVDFSEKPEKIVPHSEWSPVTVEISWLCSTDKSDEDCVRELLSSAYETFGYDDKFKTLLLFAWEG